METQPRKHLLPEHTAPRKLLEIILNRISALEARRARRQLFVGIIGTTTSFIGLWYGALYMMSELQASTFYQYNVVLFSDLDVVSLFWKEFLLGILESFPVVSALIMLSLVFLLLSSLRSTVRGTRRSPISLY